MNKPQFQGFNPRAEVSIYRRNMPHWRQRGCTYFVTFRLADSIPRDVLLRWENERKMWLKAHGVSGCPGDSEYQKLYMQIPENDRRKFERRQARQLHMELDRCHGSCVLERPSMRTLIRSSLVHFNGQRYWCGDWVVMPNHVHWLVAPLDGWDLEDILQSVKRYVSTRSDKAGRKDGRLWQKESYDRIVRDRAELSAFRKYIEQNPAKAQLSVDRFEYSRADWLD